MFLTEDVHVVNVTVNVEQPTKTIQLIYDRLKEKESSCFLQDFNTGLKNLSMFILNDTEILIIKHDYSDFETYAFSEA